MPLPVPSEKVTGRQFKHCASNVENSQAKTPTTLTIGGFGTSDMPMIGRLVSVVRKPKLNKSNRNSEISCVKFSNLNSQRKRPSLRMHEPMQPSFLVITLEVSMPTTSSTDEVNGKSTRWSVYASQWRSLNKNGY